MKRNARGFSEFFKEVLKFLVSLVIGDFLICVGCLLGCLSLGIKYHVKMIQRRCCRCVSGCVGLGDTCRLLDYTVDGRSYQKHLRSGSQAYGLVSVKVNPLCYKDAYVVGDWNDIRNIHDTILLCSVLFLVVGFLVTL